MIDRLSQKLRNTKKQPDCLDTNKEKEKAAIYLIF